jgi:hypothetical protein
MTKISDFLPDDRLPDNRVIRIVDRGRPRFVTPTRLACPPLRVTNLGWPPLQVTNLGRPAWSFFQRASMSR